MRRGLAINRYGNSSLSIIDWQGVLEGFPKIGKDLYIVVSNEHTDVSCVNIVGGKLYLIFTTNNKGMVTINKSLKIENKINLKIPSTINPDYRIKVNVI